MNREEALEIINGIERHLANQGMTEEEYSLDEALVTLGVYKQPDPITGLVPCGCGGKAETHELFGEYSGTYMTDCKECATGTTQYNTEKESQDAWNTAMGYKGGAE